MGPPSMNFVHYILLSLFSSGAMAQGDTIPTYHSGGFRAPLDVPILLAGSFGEPRPGHFHMGMDLQTLEKEGLPVYALGDGYVSRIGVSPYGYGNALYITYPNGFTSVYGHLQGFGEKITALVRKEQYAKESFSVDITVKPYELNVKKGEVVAFSGNTGASGGPHVHFEIRDVAERTINPLLFGYTMSDHIAPVIGGLKVYPMDALKHTADGYRSPLAIVKGSYSPKTGLLKVNASSIALAINTYDKMEGTTHTLGIYDIKAYDGDSIIHEYRVDRVTFDHTRDVIAQVDYPVFIKEGSRAFHKCFQEANNKIPSSYYHVRNNGVIDLSDGTVHNIKIEVRDYNGNLSTLRAQVQYDPKTVTFKAKPLKYNKVLSPYQDNNYSADGFNISIPGKALLDSMFVTYSSTPSTTNGIFSNVHKFGESQDQLLNYFTVSVKPVSLPENLKSKALIIWRNAGGGTAARSSKWEGDMLTARSREFGSYFIMIDTTPPRIVPINITPGKNMHAAKAVYMRLSDGLSGLDEYKAYIDDKWQLMEMDGKTATLKMFLPNTLTAGEHTFKLTATDERGNKAEYSVKFNY
ncbi:MAG: mepM 3 [Bacteroidetes bacterium]|nr:mepM 3 [Bacteroidota bacterium]